ncbi:MAG: HD superfamily phosphodiesterase [Myxococcota bacterium]|jgi:HD superfamily phosphodiesterase
MKTVATTVHFGPDEAFRLLQRLKAPDRLVTHGRLVLEAADVLLHGLRDLSFDIDGAWVRAGAVLHDVGKTLHPNELSGGGCAHEQAGERLLLEHGVPSHIARMCVSHGAWDSDQLASEELVVAMADKLWKGRREPELEKRFTDRVVVSLQGEPWALYVRLDSLFETVADDGGDRLLRS